MRLLLSCPVLHFRRGTALVRGHCLHNVLTCLNILGNLAGSWAGELPFSWVDQQYDLQKQIIARMVELGMCVEVFQRFTLFDN